MIITLSVMLIKCWMDGCKSLTVMFVFKVQIAIEGATNMVPNTFSHTHKKTWNHGQTFYAQISMWIHAVRVALVEHIKIGRLGNWVKNMGWKLVKCNYTHKYIWNSREKKMSWYLVWSQDFTLQVVIFMTDETAKRHSSK